MQALTDTQPAIETGGQRTPARCLMWSDPTGRFTMIPAPKVCTAGCRRDKGS